MKSYYELVKKIVWWINKKDLRDYTRNILNNLPNIDDIQSLKEEISYIKYSASKFYDRKIIFLKITNWYDKNIEYLYKFPFVLLINEIIKKKCFHLIITNYDPDIEFISVYGTKDDMFKCKNTKKYFILWNQIYIETKIIIIY